MSLQVQFFTFLMMFSSGWILGILFDTYRVVTRPFKLNRLLFSILDVIYWLFATFFVFKLLYVSNNGELRFFIFIAILFGTWFYYSYVSRYVILFVKFLIRLIKRIIGIGLKMVKQFIIRPLYLLYKLIVYILGVFMAIAIFLMKIMIQLLYPLLFVCRWLTKKVVKLIPWPGWIRKHASMLSHRMKQIFHRKR